MLRPKLDLLTEKPSKNDKNHDELNFGTVHIDKFRTIKVYLSNSTEVTAKWKLNYVKFTKKPSIRQNPKAPFVESDGLQMTDDPDVFEFSYSEVSLS